MLLLRGLECAAFRLSPPRGNKNTPPLPRRTPHPTSHIDPPHHVKYVAPARPPATRRGAAKFKTFGAHQMVADMNRDVAQSDILDKIDGEAGALDPNLVCGDVLVTGFPGFVAKHLLRRLILLQP